MCRSLTRETELKIFPFCCCWSTDHFPFFLMTTCMEQSIWNTRLDPAEQFWKKRKNRKSMPTPALLSQSQQHRAKRKSSMLASMLHYHQPSSELVQQQHHQRGFLSIRNRSRLKLLRQSTASLYYFTITQPNCHPTPQMYSESPIKTKGGCCLFQLWFFYAFYCCSDFP